MGTAAEIIRLTLLIVPLALDIAERLRVTAPVVPNESGNWQPMHRTFS
jgi:hypothetical protein